MSISDIEDRLCANVNEESDKFENIVFCLDENKNNIHYEKDINDYIFLRK